MFIIGHLGLTLAIFLIISLLIPPIRKRIDYRFVAIGALLPDLIDKLIGRLFFEEIFANGRIFAHTFLFVIALFLLGVFIYRQQRENGSGMIVLSFASLMHLLQDRMWTVPQTFLWPALGWEFPHGSVYGGFSHYLSIVTTNSFAPEVSNTYMFELAGFGVFIVVIYWQLFRIIVPHTIDQDS
ncbi:metal-dependent hydrolase [Methanococcoides sp. SA1]|nr:metal-dependent hydrolase [Methanococcoides sp. SA1]